MRVDIKNIKQSPPESGMYTVVFIDYESLYYSFIQQFAVPPELGVILNDIKSCGKIIKIKVFGDFSQNGMQQERNRIRTITSDIIDCGRGDDRIQKNHTDFIMLDHIYQECIQNPSVQQFILFTGDGHFSSAATFLRTFMDKVVGIYGIRKTLSHQLTECSSWARVVDVTGVDEERYILSLINNFFSAREKGLILTFKKTIEHVASRFGGEELKYQDVLNKLIDENYVETYMTENLYGRNSFRALAPDYEKLEELKQQILQSRQEVNL